MASAFRVVPLFAALLAAVAVAPARADPADPVLGRWQTQDADGVFQIARCGDTLCGWLIGMRYQTNMPLDVHGRPQCRLMLLSGFKPADDPGRWHGSIMDPDDGHSYDATIWSPRPGLLNLRGYLLLPMFGETQHWSRYAGSIGPNCKLPG